MTLLCCWHSIVISVTILFALASNTTTASTDIQDTLDEITDEVSKMQQSMATDGINGTTNEQRAIISDIEKLKKIAEILETVGQVVLPTVVNSQANTQKSAVSTSISSTGTGESVKILPKGLKLLQHHASIATNVDEASAVAPESVPPSSIN